MKGGSDDLGVIQRAARAIERAIPTETLPDAETVLIILSGRYYTVKELTGIVGRDKMIQSSVWDEAVAEGLAEGRAKGRAEGRAEGRIEGRIEAERALCVEMVRKHHPELLPKAIPVIEACDDPVRLKQWVLAASDRDAAVFTRLLDLA